MKRVGLILALAILVSGGNAPAQTPPTRLRATIDRIDGNRLDVTARDGSKSTVTMAPDVRITGVTIADIGAIKPDSYIGTAAAIQPDGTLRALEVHVFAPSMRGSGEGNRPWEGINNSMTNGTVGSLVVSNGRRLTVQYKGGEKIVVVPEDVPIVSLEPGNRAMLVVGAHVILLTTKAADGTTSAQSVSVGENGIVPPM